MQYALTIYDDQTKWADAPPDAPRETAEAYGKLTDEMRAAGVFRAGEGLQPVTTATTVRVPNGERIVTDGPFAETKELIGGFLLVQVRSLDEAVEWAARLSEVLDDEIEVRPIVELSDFDTAVLSDDERERQQSVRDQLRGT
jgi:hypothetical protein